jgi:hypothetical protein
MRGRHLSCPVPLMGRHHWHPVLPPLPSADANGLTLTPTDLYCCDVNVDDLMCIVSDISRHPHGHPPSSPHNSPLLPVPLHIPKQLTISGSNLKPEGSVFLVVFIMLFRAAAMVDSCSFSIWVTLASKYSYITVKAVIRGSRGARPSFTLMCWCTNFDRL